MTELHNASFTKVSPLEFLTTIFKHLPATAAAAIARKRDLSLTGWRVDPWRPGQGFKVVRAENVYYCVSSIKHEQPFRRIKQNVLALYVLMLDDVGSKVARDLIKPLPTYALETSQGNFQLGFLLKEPVNDLDKIDLISRAVSRSGLSDPSANGFSTRLARVPGGWNTKRDPIWEVRATEWRPDLLYDVDELLALLGLELDSPQQRRPAPISTATLSTPYGQAALRGICDALAAMQPDTGRNDQLNCDAYRVGQLVAGGELLVSETLDALRSAALACGLEPGEVEATMMSGFEAGQQDPRSAPENPSVSPSQSLRSETVRQKLKVLNFHEFLALELPVRGNVLFPVLPQQGLVMLYAPRGVGKTWASLSLAWAAASAGCCLGGWKADRPWKVIYIDGEMPAAVLQERLALVAQGAGGDCDPDCLTILTPDIQEAGMPNLATQEGRAALEPYIADREVIIVDNLATLSRAGRENEAESWLPMQEWCLDMRRRGKSVVLIHHAGKSGQQRGTSAREDILDTVISLRKAKDYEPSQGAKFEVHLEKARGITGKDADPFAAELIQAQDGGVTWACVPIQDERDVKVMAMLAEGLKIPEIVEETGLSRATVYRIQKRMGSAA